MKCIFKLWNNKLCCGNHIVELLFVRGFFAINDNLLIDLLNPKF